MAYWGYVTIQPTQSGSERQWGYNFLNFQKNCYRTSFHVHISAIAKSSGKAMCKLAPSEICITIINIHTMDKIKFEEAPLGEVLLYFG